MNLNLPFLQKFKSNEENNKPLLNLVLGSGSPRRKEILSKLGIPFTVDPSKFDESVIDKNNTNVSNYVRRNSIEKSIEVYCRRKKVNNEKNIIVVGADTVVTCDNKILGKPNSVENAKETLKNLRGQNHSVFTGVSILFPLKDSSIVKNDKEAIFNLKKILTKIYKNKNNDNNNNKKRKIEDNILEIKVERLPFDKSYIPNASPITSHDIFETNKSLNDIVIISFVEETQVTFSSEDEAFSDEVIDAYVATGEPMDKAGSYGYQGISAFFIEKINGCYYNVVGFPAQRFFSILKQLLE
ncbi:Maf-like protein [Anaeromyces robustus]|uniref:Maf-like protein n=1 Tax=Anaeromyces robustus TaxID=1754192 RepID=A0A1Y1XMC2_9FUNG|nr:Maf-like protein [Anaeromyces robustus]|eukprot:ORX86853.1 Maf-like protein [Anaeromyces robustus]